MAGRYRVNEVLATGGVCEVLSARVEGDEGFSRRVAIKRLLPASAANEAIREGFIDEANIVGRLQHPNIVSITDFGVVDGVPFQVLEFIDGIDLSTLQGRTEMNPPVEVALHLAREVAKALEHAHEQDIVHRDVTPKNVMVTWSGAVKLIDFGIAFAKRRRAQTALGITKGTEAFMAPEQMRGDVVDPRTDLFSLACVLHTLIVGESPLATDEARERIYTGGKVSLDPQVPEDVRHLLDRGLAAKKEDRFASAAEMVSALWALMLNRRGEDGDRAVKRWLAPFRPQTEAASPVASLFDVVSAASVDAPRAYTAVVPSPVGALDQEVTTDRGVDVAPTRVTPPNTRLSETKLTPPRPVPQTKSLFRWLGLSFVVVILAIGVGLWIRGRPERPSTEGLAVSPAVVERPVAVKAEVAEAPLEPLEERPVERPKRTKAKNRTKLDHDALTRRFRRMLSARGLTSADLAQRLEVQAQADRFSRAVADGDAKAAEDALQRMPVLLDRLAADHAMLKSKLARIYRSLKRIDDSALRAQYLELRSAVTPRRSEAELRQLTRKADELQRAINRRARGSPP